MDQSQLADAIQEDVSTEEQIATLTSPQSPRMRALAEIEEKNRARLEEEIGVKFSDDDEQVAQQLDDPTPEPIAPLEGKEATPERVKVKVDGIEKEVTQEDLVRAYQKNAAADHRLEEAALLLRQAEQLAAQNAAPLPQADPVQTDEALRKEAAETLAKLYEGDQEAAAEALINLLAKARGGDQPTPAQAPQIDEEVLAARVLDRMSIDAAFKRVETDYPDLINDPNLEMLAAIKIDQKVAAGARRADAMLEVADDLYKSLGKLPTGRQAAPDPTKNTRKENKERLDNIPTASATAMPKLSLNENPDPSSVIAELASRRLGQSLPRQTG